MKSLNTEAWISFPGWQYSMRIVTHQSGRVTHPGSLEKTMEVSQLEPSLSHPVADFSQSPL